MSGSNSSAGIVTKRTGAVHRVHIDLGADGNLLSLETIAALEHSIRAAGDSKLIALTSDGPDFCLGRDHKKRPAMANALEVRAKLTQPIMGLYEAIASASAPVVAAVQGRASGLGCALATSCDITIAAEDATFQLPELAGNLPPTLAISAMMNRMPRKSLAWLIYGMRPVNARDARLLGMVSEVVPATALQSTLEQVLADMSERSREALCAVKEYLRSAPAMSAQGAADYATSLLSSVMSSRA